MSYTVNESISSRKYRQLIKDIFDYLSSIPDTWNSDRIFIGGEADTQTEFEKQSNEGEIGVLARSKRVGHMLLFFLRMIIDDNMKLPLYIFEDKSRNTNLTMKKIIEVLGRTGRDYVSIHKRNDVIELSLYDASGRTTITKTADEIDLWTFSRIKEEIFRKLSRM